MVSSQTLYRITVLATVASRFSSQTFAWLKFPEFVQHQIYTECDMMIAQMYRELLSKLTAAILHNFVRRHATE